MRAGFGPRRSESRSGAAARRWWPVFAAVRVDAGHPRPSPLEWWGPEHPRATTLLREARHLLPSWSHPS